jgi:hypothetical protein
MHPILMALRELYPVFYLLLLLLLLFVVFGGGQTYSHPNGGQALYPYLYFWHAVRSRLLHFGHYIDVQGVRFCQMWCLTSVTLLYRRLRQDRIAWATE